MVVKHIENNSFEEGINSLESFLIFRSKWSVWLSLEGLLLAKELPCVPFLVIHTLKHITQTQKA